MKLFIFLYIFYCLPGFFVYSLNFTGTVIATTTTIFRSLHRSSFPFSDIRSSIILFLKALMSSPLSIDDLGIDILQNIVSRLPSVDFASADCVSRLWNHVCGRLLCRPKIISACSFGCSVHVVVDDVVNKVLLEMIRPHFAIASVFRFNLEEAHQLISAKLGSKVPVITNQDTSGLKATLWTWKDGSLKDDFDPSHVWETGNGGVMLTIGFVPGLKLQPISLLTKNTMCQEDSQALMVDKLITNIKDFSTSISGRQSPAAIIMFSEPRAGIDYAVLGRMDHAMSPETVIVGYQCAFQHSNGSSKNINDAEEHASGVALVFVKDTNKPPGIGETEFHVVLSSGVVSKGPVYAEACIKQRFVSRDVHTTATSTTERYVPRTLLTDGETLSNEAFEELDDMGDVCIFVGITKRRKCDIGWITSLAFYEVYRYSNYLIHVIDTEMDIETGDAFSLYYTDPTAAAKSFKQWSTIYGDKWEVVGGLIFTCSSQSKSFLDEPIVNRLGGTFYGQVYGRSDLTLYVKESQEPKPVHGCMHEYGGAYLIMSYTPL
ncbi:hypothetical protein QVD17_02292 [Tagetes erecta]|uniref:F-box domain-containing protein n=1 Tax=Tagetes erecta TaxID=13708 RepID=A0AAD8LDP6_TARER|nr:hypothetical protein QVD17_02292 [Tagetes erecta]